MIKRLLNIIVTMIKGILDKAGISVWFAGVIFLAFFAIGGYGGYKVNHWVVVDAEFCYSCHVHDYANDAWKRSVHNPTNSTCHDCHHQSMYANMKSGFYSVAPFVDKKNLIHNAPLVQDPACEKCHDRENPPSIGEIVGPLSNDEVAKVSKINDSPLHMIHLKATNRSPFTKYSWNVPPVATGNDREKHKPLHLLSLQRHETEREIHCRDCHGSEQNRAHNFVASTQNCEQCHNSAIGNREPHMHNRNCLLCHVAGFITWKEGNLEEALKIEKAANRGEDESESENESGKIATPDSENGDHSAPEVKP